jgi:transposase
MDEALLTYKSRSLIEMRIRNFKHAIRVRPLFLQDEERIPPWYLSTSWP